jgi:hypothetical protein
VNFEVNQVSLNLAELGFGLLGAVMVIVAGAAWRRARPADEA